MMQFIVKWLADITGGEVSLLISVHLPKTAGASLRLALEQHFGDRLLWDYGDRPINVRSFARNASALKNCISNVRGRPDLEKIGCIHGHFMPLKYRLLPAATGKRYVTWMRDPVERLASHYFYWLRDYQEDSIGKLKRRVVEEKWSLERFCLGPELKNLYSRFFWGFGLRRFDFIGITEHLNTDMEYFSQKFLQVNLPVTMANVNPDKKLAPYVEDMSLRTEIEAHHADDVLLYQRALRLRESRLAER
jgi:hypothetical protein